MRIENLVIKKNSVLLVIDMQDDFLPGGALAVEDGDEIIDDINMASKIFFENHHPVIFTQDWHPKDHKSFASAHPNKEPGDPIDTPGLGPILWPDHCVQGTEGAKINKSINTKRGIAKIRKGYRKKIDSYSAFFENDKKTPTGLSGFLKELGVETVYICGLALDYCCFYSAMDAKKEGFNVVFLKDLTRGIDEPKGNIDKSIEKMKEKQIEIVTFD